MLNKFFLVIILFFGTVCLTNCLPRSISSHSGRYRRAFIYGVNGIDHQDDILTSSNGTSEEAEEIILLEEEKDPWDSLVLSLRNGIPPTDRGRQRFSHFYKKKVNEPASNIDPIVFPTISEDSPTIVYAEEARVGITQSSSTIEVSTERSTEKLILSEDDVSSSSQSSSTETEVALKTENSKISLDLLSTWLWENMTPTSQVQSSTPPPAESDIGTHSLYHGPKINKGRPGKIVCPPGQRPNHFGECKRPITLKQSDYD